MARRSCRRLLLLLWAVLALAQPPAGDDSAGVDGIPVQTLPDDTLAPPFTYGARLDWAF